jgi:hypothetical protein
MFDEHEFFVYSSHKTSTQSLIKTLELNGYPSSHIHLIKNMNITSDEFIQLLKRYQTIRKKKLRIISVIRDPKDRLLSSFFQTNFNDMIFFQNQKPEETIIFKKSEEELIEIFKEQLIRRSLLGLKESLEDLSDILQIPIIEELIPKNRYFYFENSFLQLYVLDFKDMIRPKDEFILLFQQIFQIRLKDVETSNLSSEKIYYEKYKKIKENINKREDIQELIKQIYNDKFKENTSLFMNFQLPMKIQPIKNKQQKIKKN